MNRNIIIILAAGIIVLSLCIVAGLIFCPLKKSKTMTRSQIAEYRQKLRDILNKIENENERSTKLKDLAKEVGAGYISTKIACTNTVKDGNGTTTSIYQNPISESEIVLNINNALQTETMIDVCKIAARNYWITVIAALVALLSAIAAWCAIYLKK